MEWREWMGGGGGRTIAYTQCQNLTSWHCCYQCEFIEWSKLKSAASINRLICMASFRKYVFRRSEWLRNKCKKHPKCQKVSLSHKFSVLKRYGFSHPLASYITQWVQRDHFTREFSSKKLLNLILYQGHNESRSQHFTFHWLVC